MTASQSALFDDDAATPGADAAAAASIAPAQPLLARPARLADERGARLRLGTSSWSFPGWHGLVWADALPERTLSRVGLVAYARHPLLNAAGIDRGFYAPLDPSEYARYAAQVPAGFRFLVKAPGAVTDSVERDARGAGIAANPTHLDAAFATERFVLPARDGLGMRLGVLVFQFSPLPRELLTDPAAWIARLARFLQALPTGPRYAVEVRDAALVTPRLVHALADAGAGYCLALHDRMPSAARQLRALDAWEARAGAAGRAAPLVARWTLHRGVGYVEAKRRYAPFDRIVDDDPATRDALAERAAAALAAGREAIVIANNKAEGSAPLTLARLADAIAARLSG